LKRTQSAGGGVDTPPALSSRPQASNAAGAALSELEEHDPDQLFVSCTVAVPGAATTPWARDAKDEPEPERADADDRRHPGPRPQPVPEPAGGHP
jgi:hypothetical protein